MQPCKVACVLCDSAICLLCGQQKDESRTALATLHVQLSHPALFVFLRIVTCIAEQHV